MEHRTELLRLLSCLCDEQLSEADRSRLEELLADEQARRFYFQYVDMHARLLTHPAIAGDSHLPGVDALAGLVGNDAQVAVYRSGQTEAPPRQAERYRRRPLQILSYLAVAAATLAATILLHRTLLKQQRPAGRHGSPMTQQANVAMPSEATGAE